MKLVNLAYLMEKVGRVLISSAPTNTEITNYGENIFKVSLTFLIFAVDIALPF